MTRSSSKTSRRDIKRTANRVDVGDGVLVPERMTSGISFSGGRPRVTLHVLDGIPPIPVRRDIVAGLFEARELVVLVGAPKVGKSAIAVHLTQAIASGRPFLGRETRRSAVAYLALERSRETVRRLRATGSSGLPILVSRDTPALGEKADVDALIEALQAAENSLPANLPLGLIIIDTARKAFRGLRENDSDSVSIGLEALRRIMQALPDAAVVLVHHTAKDGSAARGSGAILADADIELTVRKRDGRRIVEVTGANAVDEGQTLTFDIAPIVDADGTTVVTVRPLDVPPARPPAIGSRSRTGARRLSGDAAVALEILTDLASNERVPIESWRDAVMARWSERKRGTARQAFSKAREVLTESGLIVLDGESVSVSEASARASADISADGAQASASAVSAPPLIERGADVADALADDAGDEP